MAELSQREKWAEYYQTVIEATDIKATAESWGVEFTGHTSEAGWAECRAINREDQNPSAAVNLHTGYYKDLGGGPSYPFFRFGVEYGPYQTVADCCDELAKAAKLLSKKPKSRKGESFLAKMRPKPWHPVAVSGLCRELKITPKTLEMVGAGLAIVNFDDVAVTLPVYDAERGFDAPLKGTVVRSASGGKIRHYRGKGRPEEMLGNYSIGLGGIMNRHAVHHWGTAEVIYKVEGVSDMLTLQQHIPEEFLKRHLVVTNSDGADAVNTASQFATMARGKVVIIIHDHDEPGQFGSASSKQGGASRWHRECGATAKAVYNICLYPDEPLAPKKGKDLRDWFNDGHTYADLMELVRASTPYMKENLKPDPHHQQDTETQNLDEFQAILRRLDLIVLGHSSSGAITIFNARYCRKFSINDIDRFSYNKQLIHIGEAAVELIADPTDQSAPDDLIDCNDVRVAISREACGKELSRTNTIGVGIWESQGRMVAVGAGEWIAVNGGVSKYRSPMVEDKIVDYGEAHDEWYDSELLDEYLESAKSPAWRWQHFCELREIMDRWENHLHPNAGQALAALMIATWAQSVWDWRPWVAITGESSSGKTLLFSFLGDYFGPLGIKCSGSSEAGLRNTIGSSGRILMHDEFENSPHRTAILEMLMASNRKGGFGATLRSNASQASVVSAYQLLPWFAGVEMKMDKQTEANRYITFELGNRAGMGMIHVPKDSEDMIRLRNKSIACVMRCWQQIKEYSNGILASMGGNYTRQSESYALISSVWAAMKGESLEKAIDHHNRMMLELMDDNVVEKEETEQEMLLAAIVHSQVQDRNGKRITIGSLLDVKDARSAFETNSLETLQQHGIMRFEYSRICKLKDYLDCERSGKVLPGEYIFLDTSKSGQIVRTLLRGTSFERLNLRAILSRLPGAFKSLMRCGTPTKGVFVPVSQFIDVADGHEMSTQESGGFNPSDFDSI